MPAELTVVTPCFNEEGAIETVVRAWCQELERLGIDYQIRAYDDGSRDATPRILKRLAAENPRLVPIRQSNRGHGPTVLRAYGEATSPWVFQVDSDDELPVDGFADLWSRREGFDLLVAARRDREQSPVRALISAGSRLAVRLCFGAGLADVNSPYRLFRRSALQRLLPSVPADAFAPNVILSGLAVRERLRIYEGSVVHRQRRTGRESLTSLKLWRSAARALGETLSCALRTRRGSV